jgi:uncharacterized DUF497 family protein
MKLLRWNAGKNEVLRVERGVSFDEIEVAIEQGNLLDIVAHPNRAKYPNQRIFVVRLLDYVYLVPFVEDQSSFFLKTIIPSRKATKQYLGVEHAEEE